MLPRKDSTNVKKPRQQAPAKADDARTLEAKPRTGTIDYAQLRKATMTRFAKTLAHLAK